jgi:molybdate transport system permease protein
MDSSRTDRESRSRVFPVLDVQPGLSRGRLRMVPSASLWWLTGLPLLAFLTIPLIALLVWTDADLLRASLARPEVLQAIGLSLKTSLIATGVTLLFGTTLAYALARRTMPLRRLWDTLVDLPMVLPPAVAGVALLVAFGRRGIVGGLLEDWGIHIAFTQAAVVLAQTFVAAPLFIRTAIIGFSAIDSELEEAAKLDGAGERQLFRFVTLPLSRKALLSGAVLTWARALGEFGATIIFAGNFPGRTQTMPLAIYLGFELDLSVALTLSVFLMGASFVTLVLVKFFLA